VPSRPRRSHRVPRPVGPGAGRVTRRLAGRVALGAGAGATLVAVSGFRPLTRRWPAALAASLLAALATEIPRPTTAAVLAIEAEAARQGAARTPAGRLGVALAAGAVLALRVLDARTRTTHRVLEHALRDVLGPGCKRTRRRPRPPLPWLGGLAAERWRVVRERNISYGSDPVNVLDVWRRPDLLPGAGAPVLLQVHGGAWSAGGKEGDARPLLTHLADRGWVCLAVDYRLGPGHRWPAMIDDVRTALAWTRENIRAHGGDPDAIVLSGGSAGAQLAALTALTDGSGVAAVVVSYGIYDLTTDDGSGTLADLLERTMMPDRGEVEVWRSASPTHRVHSDAPPFLVLHGSGDAVVSTHQSRAFVRALRAVSGAPVAYAELPHAQHFFDALPTARTLQTVRAVEEFLDVVVRGLRRPARGAGRGQ